MSGRPRHEGHNGQNRVWAILARAVVWDNHSCMPLRANDDFLPQLERCRHAGYTAITLNMGLLRPASYRIVVLAHFRRLLKARSNRYLLIEHPDDVLAAKRSVRLAVGFNIEGGCAPGGQLGMVSL